MPYLLPCTLSAMQADLSVQCMQAQPHVLDPEGIAIMGA